MFNVGDKVRINIELHNEDNEEPIGWDYEMENYDEDEFVIKEILERNSFEYDRAQYVEYGSWEWDLRWLELVQPEHTFNYWENLYNNICIELETK